MTSSPRLEQVTPDNIADAFKIRIRPEQEGTVASVERSLAEAYASRETAWPRLVCDGDEVVGFIMGNFDLDAPIDLFRCGIWRLNIDAKHQGRGYGRFAVEALCAEARRRGGKRVTVLWEVHEHGPEEFYLKLGFRRTGQIFEGEIVGELLLD
ncbi:GNAT family N-acetyltransferase [Planomonospora sp. ID67723]|uniref:GNAT family N-acetyltransferase n=1 Tax=Planomonospora sp. ID67723 TaxID=2738134 RepID=UPI0018C3F737|nr:GNAT family N-acetyltransferase [Planomonospora sp. ID67723]MBG0828810.1 GNAT family N-acetyltransferase [Planomonospora sp. ID67723]